MVKGIGLRLTLMLLQEMKGKRGVHQTTRYDAELSAIAYLWEHPRALPWVGAEYDRYRLLFVGVAAASRGHHDPVTRHKGQGGRVAPYPLPEYPAWQDIRTILATGCHQTYPAASHARFARLEQAMLASGFAPPDPRQVFRYAACYLDASLIRLTDPQPPGRSRRWVLEEAAATFADIVETLQPRWICVVGLPLWRIMLQTGALIHGDVCRGRDTATCRWVRCVAAAFPEPDSHGWRRVPRQPVATASGMAPSGQDKLSQFLRRWQVFNPKEQ